MFTFKEFVMESTFNKTYFKTSFKFKHSNLSLPSHFAIISASDINENARNQILDMTLKQALKKANVWCERVFCISKKGVEKCWATDVSFLQAKIIGNKFNQDAFFYIEQNHLFVAKCNNLQAEKVYVGIFTDKIIK